MASTPGGGCHFLLQGGGEDGQGIGPLRFQLADAGVDEGQVAAHPVRAVEEQTDRRPGRVAAGQPVGQRRAARQVGMVDAVLRLLDGRGVAEAGQQQVIGQEAQQLGRGCPARPPGGRRSPRGPRPATRSRRRSARDRGCRCR